MSVASRRQLALRRCLLKIAKQTGILEGTKDTKMSGYEIGTAGRVARNLPDLAP